MKTILQICFKNSRIHIIHSEKLLVVSDDRDRRLSTIFIVQKPITGDKTIWSYNVLGEFETDSINYRALCQLTNSYERK